MTAWRLGHMRARAARHHALRRGRNHPIIHCNEIVTWLRAPRWLADSTLQGFQTPRNLGVSHERGEGRTPITPSGLSVLIRELERQLEFRLFDRTTRQVTLTAFGSELIAVTEPSLGALDAASNRPKAGNDGSQSEPLPGLRQMYYRQPSSNSVSAVRICIFAYSTAGWTRFSSAFKPESLIWEWGSSRTPRE